MSNIFDTTFAAVAAQNVPSGETATGNVVVTTLDPANNHVTYGTGVLTFIPGVHSPIPNLSTPSSFSNNSPGVPIPQLFSQNNGADGGPFDPKSADPMIVTITAPSSIGIKQTGYLVEIVFNAGKKDQFTLNFSPSFEPTSGVAFSSINLPTATLVTISLLPGGLLQPAPH